MVDGGFRENIFGAEYFSNQTFPEKEYEIIWVEYYDRANRFLDQYHRIKVVELKKKDVYHSSYCFNAGIKEARGEVLVIPDADVLVERDFLSNVYEEHSKHHDLVMYFYRYCQEEEFFKNSDFSFEYIKRTSRIRGSDNYGGCLSVRKKWLVKIGGYEQHRAFATGNHANGRDVYTRLKNLGLCVKWHPERYIYHPWHPGTGGVGANRKRVKWQQEIIKYRSVQLMTSAFEGLGVASTSGYKIPLAPLGDPDQ